MDTVTRSTIWRIALCKKVESALFIKNMRHLEHQAEGRAMGVKCHGRKIPSALEQMEQTMDVPEWTEWNRKNGSWTMSVVW